MLKDRMRSGRFNLELFVEIMESDGYITEIDAPEGAGFSSSYMERTSTLQEEFNDVFSFFYPDQYNEIIFGCVATNKGFIVEAGAYSYALYNKRRIAREDVLDILIAQNRNSGY